MLSEKSGSMLRSILSEQSARSQTIFVRLRVLESLCVLEMKVKMVQIGH
jgi:hypothetical protein